MRHAILTCVASVCPHIKLSINLPIFKIKPTERLGEIAFTLYQFGQNDILIFYLLTHVHDVTLTIFCSIEKN